HCASWVSGWARGLHSCCGGRRGKLFQIQQTVFSAETGQSVKILFTNFHSNDGGGHVTYILSLARALSPVYDVTIATPPTGRLYRYAQSIPHVKVVEQWYTSRIQKMAPEVGRLRQHIKAA